MHIVMVALGVTAALLVGRHDSHASCNSIPAVAAVGSSPSGAPMYKAALGSISQTFAMPGVSKSITLYSDDTCVNAVDSDLEFEQPNADGYVVALLNAVDDRENSILYPLVLTSTPAACDEIGQSMTTRFGERWRCAPAAVRRPLSQEFSRSIEFSLAELPAEVTELLAADGESPAPITFSHGRMKLVAINKAEKVAELASRVATHRCADLCTELASAGAYACVDDIYVASGPSAFLVAKLGCGITQLPSNLTPVVFKDQCDDKSGTPPSFPTCKAHGGDNKLEFYVDDCGNLMVPLDFTDLIDPNAGIKERFASGKSAASRELEGDENNGQQLWIPGREFIGSTLLSDVKGAASNWKLPRMDVFWDNKSETFGIRGIVDKTDAHVLHIVPRLGVTRLCKSSPHEACEKTDDVSTCACSDRYQADCECDPLSEQDAMYFACNGGGANGKLDGMPCTRPAHCLPGGTCTRQPKCQPKHTVFDPTNAGAGVTSCWNDTICPATTHQCGYSLFNFTNRFKSQNSRVVRLKSKVKKNSGPNRRGICKESTGTVCNQNNLSNKCTGTDDACVGYKLTAEGRVGP